MNHKTIHIGNNCFECTVCDWYGHMANGRLHIENHGNLGATHSAFVASNDIQGRITADVTTEGLSTDIIEQIEDMEL